MTDDACKAYGSLPDRLYIVHRGKVVYQGGRGPFEYKVINFIVRNLPLPRSQERLNEFGFFSIYFLNYALTSMFTS